MALVERSEAKSLEKRITSENVSAALSAGCRLRKERGDGWEGQEVERSGLITSTWPFPPDSKLCRASSAFTFFFWSGHFLKYSRNLAKIVTEVSVKALRGF